MVQEPLLDNSSTPDLGPFFENPHGDKYLFPINHNTFASLSVSEVYLDYFGKDGFREDCLYNFLRK